MEGEQVCELRERVSRIEAVIAAAAELASAMPAERNTGLARLASLIAVAEEQATRTLSWIDGTQVRNPAVAVAVKSIPA